MAEETTETALNTRSGTKISQEGRPRSIEIGVMKHQKVRTDSSATIVLAPAMEDAYVESRKWIATFVLNDLRSGNIFSSNERNSFSS
jgi:hypothetical protein